MSVTRVFERFVPGMGWALPLFAGPVKIVLVGGVCIVLLPLAAMLTENGLLRMQDALQSEHWPVAEGTVVESRVREGYAVIRGERLPLWLPVVEYDYAVGPKRYRGTRVLAHVVAMRTEQAAQERVARYPVGAGVQVRHHPRRPEEAVLETRGCSVWGAVLVLLGALVCLAAPVALVWTMVRNLALRRDGGEPGSPRDPQ
jgi:hypothetical protein